MMWTDHGHQDFYRKRQSGNERPGLAIQRVAEATCLLAALII